MDIWNKISFLSFAVLLLAACGEKEASVTTPRESQLTLTGISSGGIEVKSGEGLKPQNFGIMVTNNSSTTAYQTYLRNVEARDDGSESFTGWRFRYDGSSVLFNNLFLVEKIVGLEAARADVYAYAPFKSGLTPSNLSAFSYSITDQKDLMWARQNASDFDFSGLTYNNRNIAVDGETKAVRFDFVHLLCKLQFCFRIKNSPGPNYRVVGMKLTPGTDKLRGSGSFNMLTGAFTPTAFRNEAFELTGTADRPLADVPVDGSYSAPIDLLLCPRDYSDASNSYADDDYRFEFKLYGVDSYLPHANYVMKKAHLRYAEGQYGLKPGYVYTFYFTFDDYIHFDGVKTEDWVDEQKEYGI